MVPDWMKAQDDYVPPKKGGTFAVKTIAAVAEMTGRLRFQQGKERKYAPPALLKLLLVLAAIICLSLSRQPLVLLAFTAAFLVCLCILPPPDILSILKASLAAALFTGLLLVPAMIMDPAGACNHGKLIGKVFLSVGLVSILNHTTQWNHITGALRKLHVPGIFIFTIDITLKYIMILGRFIQDLLTSYQLRAVGGDRKADKSAGGIMGTAFLRGTEMSRDLYDAMVCRGFTDDYKGL